jgi:hypothetical protein
MRSLFLLILLTLAFVEAYTPIPSSDSSTLSCIYLSTSSNTTYTHADLSTSPSDRLAPYTDLFLSAIAKKVHPVIGELPEKFHIEHKIIGNPLDNLPILNPNPPPFIPSDRYTSSDETNSTRTILATSCDQRRET